MRRSGERLQEVVCMHVGCSCRWHDGLPACIRALARWPVDKGRLMQLSLPPRQACRPGAGLVTSCLLCGPYVACSKSDRERLRFLYEEWAHPYFVSKEEYGRIMEVRCRWWLCAV